MEEIRIRLNITNHLFFNNLTLCSVFRPDGRCSDNSNNGEISDYTLQRSPLITRSHQCITLRPMGSPLLMSEYLSDENENESHASGSQNSMNHHYESTSPYRSAAMMAVNYYTLRQPHSSHYAMPIVSIPPPLPPERKQRQHQYSTPTRGLYDYSYGRYHHQRIT